MKSSCCKLIVVAVLSIIMFNVYTYLFNSIVRVDYMRVIYQIDPHLINVLAYIKGAIIWFSKSITLYITFITISLLVYIQTSLHRSWLKTGCFLLVYPLIVLLSAHMIFYLLCAIPMSILYISYNAFPIVNTLVYTLFILFIAVVYSKLARLQSDSLFESDKINQSVQSVLYSLLFVYFIWQVTSHTLSYNFFINYYNDSKIDSLINTFTCFYTLFTLTYLVLWTYPYLSSSKQRDNFTRLSSTIFIICILWCLVIVVVYKTGFLYDLMRWSSDADKYKKSVILLLVFAAFIFFMRKKIYQGVHYLLCFIIAFLLVVTLNKQNSDMLSPLALQLSYISAYTVIFYIIHSIAFRVAFYKRKNINKESMSS